MKKFSLFIGIICFIASIKADALASGNNMLILFSASSFGCALLFSIFIHLNKKETVDSIKDLKQNEEDHLRQMYDEFSKCTESMDLITNNCSNYMKTTAERMQKFESASETHLNAMSKNIQSSLSSLAASIQALKDEKEFFEKIVTAQESRDSKLFETYTQKIEELNKKCEEYLKIADKKLTDIRQNETNWLNQSERRLTVSITSLSNTITTLKDEKKFFENIVAQQEERDKNLAKNYAESINKMTQAYNEYIIEQKKLMDNYMTDQKNLIEEDANNKVDYISLLETQSKTTVEDLSNMVKELVEGIDNRIKEMQKHIQDIDRKHNSLIEEQSKTEQKISSLIESTTEAMSESTKLIDKVTETMQGITENDWNYIKELLNEN